MVQYFFLSFLEPKYTDSQISKLKNNFRDRHLDIESRDNYPPLRMKLLDTVYFCRMVSEQK